MLIPTAKELVREKWWTPLIGTGGTAAGCKSVHVPFLGFVSRSNEWGGYLWFGKFGSGLPSSNSNSTEPVEFLSNTGVGWTTFPALVCRNSSARASRHRVAFNIMVGNFVTVTFPFDIVKYFPY